jgi:hypothetical protein
MARALVTIGLLLAAAGLAAQAGESKRIPVRWNEDRALERGALAFRIRSIEYDNNGWRVRGGFTNRSPFPIRLILHPPDEPAYRDGIPFSLLYTTFEGVNPRRDPPRTVPVEARSISPAPPSTLRPGASWNGTFGGPQRLPRGKRLSVGFGYFVYRTYRTYAFGYFTQHTFFARP